jgi:hypothetical protein
VPAATTDFVLISVPDAIKWRNRKGRAILTINDLLERVIDVRQRHPEIGEWAMHVEVPDGCKEWANIALEEITVDTVN